MVDHFASLSTNPLVYLAYPPRAFTNSYGISGTIIHDQIIPLINQVAGAKRLPVIDVDTPTAPHAAWFPDGVHPNDSGYMLVAQVMHDGLLRPLDSTGAGGQGGQAGRAGQAGQGRRRRSRGSRGKWRRGRRRFGERRRRWTGCDRRRRRHGRQHVDRWSLRHRRVRDGRGELRGDRRVERHGRLDRLRRDLCAGNRRNGWRHRLSGQRQRLLVPAAGEPPDPVGCNRFAGDRAVPFPTPAAQTLTHPWAAIAQVVAPRAGNLRCLCGRTWRVAAQSWVIVLARRVQRPRVATLQCERIDLLRGMLGGGHKTTPMEDIVRLLRHEALDPGAQFEATQGQVVVRSLDDLEHEVSRLDPDRNRFDCTAQILILHPDSGARFEHQVERRLGRAAEAGEPARGRRPRAAAPRRLARRAPDRAPASAARRTSSSAE